MLVTRHSLAKLPTVLDFFLKKQGWDPLCYLAVLSNLLELMGSSNPPVSASCVPGTMDSHMAAPLVSDATQGVIVFV